MRRIFTLLTALVMVFGSTVPAYALLIDKGGGLIYDDDLDITWLQNANYTGGMMTWSDAMTWADTLSYYDSVRDYTYTDWRLPENLPVNGVSYDYSFSYDGSTDRGYNITSPNCEIAYMFYVNLGNLGYFDTSGSAPQPGWGLSNTGPFINVQPNDYWTGTEYLPPGDVALFFGFNTGLQAQDGMVSTNYVWAVRPGDVIPEPATISLLALGLLVLRRRKSA